MIPYGKQDIDDSDIQAVVDVLRSDFITQGEKVPEFERKLCEYTGAEYAVVANSATSCLHLACLALDLGPGDSLWCPPITFVASANCARYCGASIDFVDIDPLTANIDPTQLQRKLANAESKGTLPKALVVVHMGGNPCDMPLISKLAKSYGVALIEDASHAVGASYGDSPVGSCHYADITVFSFHPVKIITTAEGGAAMTNDVAIAHRLRLFRSHGITRDPEEMEGISDGPWYYQQNCLGFNYRMTEIQAALGVSQMGRLDQYVKVRNQLADIYDHAFTMLPLVPIRPIDGTFSSYHLYMILLDQKYAGPGRLRIFNQLRTEGIGVNVHYIPVHTQPYYKNLGFKPDSFPGSISYYSRVISLPLFPGLSSENQNKVIAAVKKAVKE